jgi:beta-aspartyl-peptidase (threonine type)
MDGSTMKAGAVAGLKHIKNPIRLARLVMEKSPHVMMAGEGAEAFAKEQGGIEFVDQKYFYTERSWKALQDALAAEKQSAKADDHHGTVGAVALDQHGNLAAGTSTGGLTNKRFGRIGDSPIIRAAASPRPASVSSGSGTPSHTTSARASSTAARLSRLRRTTSSSVS